MGQFKPMVKMMTTEPTVELKLKKGGAVMMKKGGSTKAVKKMDGGALGALAGTPALVGRPAVNAPVASPGRPSMSARRRAMAMRPMGRTMKEGGEAEETMAEHKAEAKATSDVAKKLKEHAGKPASKAHKGLATGGVVMGQGGYKKGGKVMKKSHGGIITEQEGSRDAGAYKNTMMHTAKPDHSPAKTGEVKLGNAGGYKTGGVAKSNAGGYKKGGMPMKDGKPAFLAKKKGGAAKKFEKGGDVTDRAQKKSREELESGMNLAEMFSKYGSDVAKIIPSKAKSSDSSSKEEGKGFAYKKGGAAKKYANGGSVNDSGKAVGMPQGQKTPSTPVSINQLSGTFKKGGAVMTSAEKRLHGQFEKENAPAMKAAKAKDVEVYSKYGKMKKRNGGMC